MDSNASRHRPRLKNAYKSQLLVTELAALYSGANVTFTLTQPSRQLRHRSSSVSYSVVRLLADQHRGRDSTNPGVLGLAIFDPSNTTQNDNTQTDFSGSQRLGVFLHTIVDSGLRPAVGRATSG